MPNKEVIDYFIVAVTAKFDKIDSRFDKQDAILEKLSKSKWMSVGAMTAISAVSGFAATVLTLYFLSKGA